MLISCAVTTQLICAFVFAYADCLYSDAAAHFRFRESNDFTIFAARSCYCAADLCLCFCLHESRFSCTVAQVYVDFFMFFIRTLVVAFEFYFFKVFNFCETLRASYQKAIMKTCSCNTCIQIFLKL